MPLRRKDVPARAPMNAWRRILRIGDCLIGKMLITAVVDVLAEHAGVPQNTVVSVIDLNRHARRQWHFCGEI